MTDRQITLDKTNHIKAFALILMMFHHLFGCGSFLTHEENTWYSLFPDFVTTISGSAKICISIFLFCSGYGLFKSYINKESVKKTYILKRILKVLIPYWVIMLFTIIYLMLVGKFNPQYIFVNLFALLHNDDMLYVSFSWFIKLYLLVLLVMPIIKKYEKLSRNNVVLDIMTYIIIPLLVANALRGFSNEVSFVSLPHFLISTIQFLFEWFPLVSIGILFAKYDTYEMTRTITDRIPKLIVLILSILGIIIVLLARYKFYYGTLSDLLFSPMIIVAFLLALDSTKRHSQFIVPFIGKTSLHYWLISGIFFLNTAELHWIIYLPKYAIACFLWCMILLTPLVIVCDYISGKAVSLICKKL